MASRIDRLARQTHRRGVLAALGALLVAPAAARAQLTCGIEGSGCTLWSPCCAGYVCVERQALNPNDGVCVARPGTATDLLNCEEFSDNWARAQVEVMNNPSDPHGLDGDNDTWACEELMP